LSDCNHRRHVEARVKALLATADGDTLVNLWSCDVSKLIRSLKLGKPCCFDDISNECLRNLPGRPLVHLTHLFNRCLRLGHVPEPWKDAKFITLLKPGKYPKSPPKLTE
jgi:hypothetical protein